MDASSGFLHVFELIVVAGLIHFYRRVGHGFLRYGAIAICINLVYELAASAGFLPRDGINRTGFETASVVFFGFCALDLAGRGKAAWKLAVAGAVLFLTAVVATPIVAPSMVPIATGLPQAVLFLFCAVTAAVATSRSFGVLLFAGLSACAALNQLAVPPWTGTGGVPAQLVYLVVGVTLMMITSERAIADLGARDRRIERYAEDRKRLELQFSQAQKLESLGMLAGGIAHDFNNMLTSILGYANLAMKKLSPESEVRKDLYMVMSGARQAVDLTSQMLTYAGKGVLEFETVDISRVVENLSSLINSIVPKQVQVVQRLARDLPSMSGDRVQLGQVVMNLIGNAVDAMEDNAGTIEVVTGLADVDTATLRMSFFAEEMEPGAFLYLRVRDTGIGMTSDQIGRIFDPFYSEKGSSKGLGLSSLSGIVRQHRGCISVKSRPGEGTDFIIYFPIVSVADTERRAPELPAPQRRTNSRVLLADDDPRIRSLMVSILESENYSIVAAEDGREALSLWREHRGDFDILVLDCTMPKLSGTDVYRQIRSEGVVTPVVLVSGYHQEQVARHIENDPVGRFIKKPFNVDDFLAEVEGLLSRKAKRRI